MISGFTGALIGVLGVAICLGAFYFALRMTRDKPTARIAALIGAVSLTLLTTFVVYNLNRSLSGPDARATEQPR